MRRLGLIAALAAALVALGAGTATAISLQPIGSFDEPTYVTSDPAQPERLLVVERAGRVIEVWGTTRVLADISTIVDPTGEGGLLSAAPAPDFAASGRLFVFYTGEEEASPEIHVGELRLGAGTAGPGDLRNLVTIQHPGDQNHYGGQLQVGPDGKLYASTGDGGGQNDDHRNAQDPSSRLGKLLRIDASMEPPAVENWALGLRNPYRFSFDWATGELWIGDVGQGAREEIDRAPAPPLGAGSNFGWSCREGFLAGPAADPLCTGKGQDDFVDPVFDYVNPGDDCAAVIGGYVVRDPSLPTLFGRYVYGDLCSGQIRSFDPATPGATDRSEGLTVPALYSFGEDSCGRVYAVSGSGGVWRLSDAQGVCLVEQLPIPPVVLEKPRPGPLAQVDPRRATHLRIRAAKHRVKRGSRARITVTASPCPALRGHRVSLWRGRKRLATRRLDRGCRARFHPRITHRSPLRAGLSGDPTLLSSVSRRLTVRPLKVHQMPRPAHRR